MDNKSLFIISNGSADFHPKNSLTNFKNKLPSGIEFNKNFEVAVKSIGFSTNFKTICVPPENYPSFFISKSPVPSFEITPKEDQVYFRAERLKTLINELDYLGSDGTKKRRKREEEDFIEPYIEDEEEYETSTNTFPFYFKDNETYETAKLKDYFQKVKFKTKCNITYENDELSFKVNEDSLSETVGQLKNSYWLVIHNEFAKSFKIEPFIISEIKYNEYRGIPDFSEIVISKLNNKIVFKTYRDFVKVFYKGEQYWALYIQSKLHEIKCTDFEEKQFPKLVKLQCSNITPQIMDSNFSQDLVVFCPDFEKTTSFFYHEFDSLQFVPLSNSILNDIGLKLCDEENRLLQLAPGTPSIIKLTFKKMEEDRKSFNVRLTSTQTKNYPTNTSASFKVKLPNTLNLSRNWKVALTSISHPNNFNAFLADEDSRSLSVSWRNPYNENSMSEPLLIKNKLVLKEDYADEADLIDELKTFFNDKDIGDVKLEENTNRICFYFKRVGSLTIGNYLLRILGFTHNSLLSTTKKYTRFALNPSVNFEHIKIVNEQILFCFQDKIRLNLLDPKYICMYANFISPTILGGEYHKILRIIPIRESKTGFIISEFKHREFYELQNTEISDLEIHLRAHDGELINFKSKQNIILNLLFSNYVQE